jgi:hypothetical protein
MARHFGPSNLRCTSANIFCPHALELWKIEPGVVRISHPPRGRRQYTADTIARKSRGAANTPATPAKCGSVPTITHVKEKLWEARDA